MALYDPEDDTDRPKILVIKSNVLARVESLRITVISICLLEL